jgi:xanthine dehydrogenase small subunit
MATNSSTIRFVLDNRIHQIDFSAAGLKPTTSVLNYLRSLQGHKGVKEGCAEGDCGACTVVLAEIENNNQLRYYSVDSCLVFLPMIHGKQLITIENLINGGQLHPTQKAMVQTDGSQCGYCTPGIVMSLFALFHNEKNPAKETIASALAGNLCRCTGYRPIMEAAHKMYENGNRDHFDESESKTLKMLQQIGEEKTVIEIVTAEQIYLKPQTLEDALFLRRRHPEAIVIAGSTDIALLQTKKRLHLASILDISAVTDFNFIVEDHLHLAIGALTSLEEVRRYAKNKLPFLSDILEVFGSLQIRNLATIGGNLGTASPIGDTLPVFMVLESVVTLINFEGRRQIPIEEFIVDYRKTALKNDELIGGISFMKPAPFEIIRSYKISKRKDLDISSVSATFRLSVDASNKIEKVLIAFGGVSAKPERAVATEEFLDDKPWNRQTIEEASQILYNEFNPISDARAGAEARRLMARNLLFKFWDDNKQTAC